MLHSYLSRRAISARHTRRLLTRLAAIVFVAGVVGVPTIALHAPAASAGSNVSNGAIADKALAYQGRWGGAACVDAGTSGYQGGRPLGDSDNMDGECRAFVNCVIKMVAGINVAYGNDDYNRAFREQGGQPVSLTGGMKGDVIQAGNGGHTAIIVSNLGNGTYKVVDSNYVGRHKVGVHNWTPPSYAQIWRMGTQRIAIRSNANGLFSSAELGYGGNDYAMVRARAGGIGSWEIFSILGDCSRNCAIRSEANGRFLSAELGYRGAAYGEIRARASAAQGWEQFRFSPGNCESGCGILALSNNRYISAELGYGGNGKGMLRARAEGIGSWEVFQIRPV